jgi:hypothetical protein
VLEGDGLELWFQQNHIPDKTRSLISAIRSSGPSRRVGGGSSNVCGRYPSKKMGVTIQFESHRVELAGIYEMEHTVRSWNTSISLSRSNWCMQVPQEEEWGYGILPISLSSVIVRLDGKNGKQRKSFSA